AGHLELAGLVAAPVVQVPARSLACCFPLGEEQSPFHRAQMVEEEDAVQVIDLVLRRPRFETGELDLVKAAVAIERLDGHAEATLHLAVDIGDREAAFFCGFPNVAGRSEEHTSEL